jgi:hypothetical protein
MELGTIVWTRSINERVARDLKFAEFVAASFKRYCKGDFGELCDEDKKENELALKEGYRILASYKYGKEKIWIITEADRSVTTILFPEDY